MRRGLSSKGILGQSLRLLPVTEAWRGMWFADQSPFDVRKWKKTFEFQIHAGSTVQFPCWFSGEISNSIGKTPKWLTLFLFRSDPSSESVYAARIWKPGAAY